MAVRGRDARRTSWHAAVLAMVRASATFGATAALLSCGVVVRVCAGVVEGAGLVWAGMKSGMGGIACNLW